MSSNPPGAVNLQAHHIVQLRVSLFEAVGGNNGQNLFLRFSWSRILPFPTSAGPAWTGGAGSLVGLDLVDMGFGGNALLDPFTARAIRDSSADIISV